MQVVGQLNAEFPYGLNAAASNEFPSFNLIDLNTTDLTTQHEILALMTATSTQFPEIQISESSVISVISDLPKTWPLLEYPNIKYQLLFQPLLQTISTGHVRYSEQCPNSNISSYGNLIIDVRQTPRANSNGSQIAF